MMLERDWYVDQTHKLAERGPATAILTCGKVATCRAERVAGGRQEGLDELGEADAVVGVEAPGGLGGGEGGSGPGQGAQAGGDSLERREVLPNELQMTILVPGIDIR